MPVSTFTVDPARLGTPAVTCRRAAESLDGVARAVGVLQVPTGRADSEAQAAHLLHSLVASVRAVAAGARDDARLLASAGERYAAAEHRAHGG